MDVELNQPEKRPPAALPTGTRPVAIPPTSDPSAKGVRIEESENGVDHSKLTRRGGTGAQRVRGAAEDDADAREEERDRERRGDRSERRRVGSPEDGEHEDQPDVVGLLHRGHRMVRVFAGLLAAPPATGEELPEACAESAPARTG
jgi:hypothetical protein